MRYFYLLKHTVSGLIFFFAMSIHQRDLSITVPSSLNEYTTTIEPKAALVFKQVKTKITDTEKNQIANQLKLLKYHPKTKKLILSISDDGEPEDGGEDFSPSFDLKVYPIDYNKDGTEEFFIFLSSDFLSGTASPPLIFVFYKVNNQYKLILEGEAYKIQLNELKKSAFPELCLADEQKWIKSKAAVPGSLFIWNGNEYKESKTKTPKTGGFKWVDIVLASKNYQTGI